MHSTFRKRGVILAGLLALALAAVTPAVATAKPEPGAKGKGGFRLFARSLGAMTVNRVYLGLNSDGEVGVDSTNSSTIGGGFWPKGTPDQYIFNSGLQIAGVVSNPGGAWDNDTTGAFFFDPKGTTQHGVEVEPIYNTTNPDDFAAIRDAAPGSEIAAGRVPSGSDANASLYVPLLQDRVQASQGDVWFMSWDGNPSLNAGRKHPLGVVVETRGMGWNYPTGNEDIAYFTYTFYNVTSTNPADYVNIRPEMKSILLDKAQEFQASNNAAFGVSLPAGGYTITNMYAAFATDMDVATSGQNWSSVNLPFAMGYTYADKMAPAPGWTFDAATFSGSFFAGVGFAGIKYLKSPTGPGAIQLFSNTINGSPFSGAFNDPQNTTQLWRYLSANISIPAGDQPCNMGLPSATHICWVNNTQPADMRFFQSSTGLTLPPGGQGTIVVAYIFAAPVKIGSCNAAPCPVIKPGTAPYLLGDPSQPSNGATAIDSLTGYRGCTDLDGSLKCEQTGTLGNEWNVVPGSLLGKAYTAQAVFDAKFLLPFAPDAPQFFLIPGDNQVTVMWQPTPSEVSGDPYYFVASNVNSPLYDPNYRLVDVEGYRIYRGRVDNADELNLIAQFDYKGTVFKDYDGIVNAVNTCAPNIPVPAVGSTGCPVAYSKPWTVGVPRTVAHDNPIVSPFTQVQPANRLLLGTGLVYDTDVDTVVTGHASGLPPLEDTGVPFVYVDTDVRNNFRYFYVVTAFDVNSIVSGPTSLESGKSATVAVVPAAPASNYQNSVSFSQGIYGRDVLLTSSTSAGPTLDPTTGRFAGPMPASNAWTIGFQDFVSSVISAPGNFAVHLDSITLGSSYDTPITPTVYHLRAINGPNVTNLTLPLAQDPTSGTVSGFAAFDAVQIDSSLAAIYGGDGNYYLKGQVTMTLVGTYYTNAYGRGCVNNADGFGTASTQCEYNGPRWFDGPSPANNETMNDPNSGNGVNNGSPITVNTALPNSTGWNNAGALSGVLVVHNPQSYNTLQNTWRQIEGIGSGAKRTADYNVYWGAGGHVDSVVDVTHNVIVPFDSTLYRGGWGFLNAANANNLLSYDTRLQLTPADVGCVEPYRSNASGGAATGVIPCTGPAYVLRSTAVPGPTAFITTSVSNATWGAKNAPVATNPGFIMLLGGEIYQFQLADLAGTLPAAGTVWSARDYAGAITGGSGFGGNTGLPYAFHNVPRPFTAVDAEVRVNYNVVNQVNAATNQGLEAVHTVPDPYYVTNAYENTYDNHVIMFVNLPTQATIRIYSSSGVLVRTLQYTSPELGGSLAWNVKNRNNQVVASGVYFYQIESGDARRIGRMTIVTFAK